MKIGGTYAVPFVPERAFELLQDPAVLCRCMPGCESLTKTGDGEYAMQMKMALAAISGKFDGKVRITESQAPTQFRLAVEGAGKIGFMKGSGLLTISPSGAGSNVQYDGDVQVGGTIASVGQRLVETTAKMLIKRFFDKLGAET
ncbi:MAG: carbon monoxide dehydrogenase subunit [Candidatus Solibacter sp.]|nr:carbon monoxide dehydrogenase subunit [Candidatus Solibacter sp.]